jgi:hypothetical protein
MVELGNRCVVVDVVVDVFCFLFQNTIAQREALSSILLLFSTAMLGLRFFLTTAV